MDALILTNLKYFNYKGDTKITVNDSQLIKVNNESEVMAKLEDPEIMLELGMLFIASLTDSFYFYFKGSFEDANQITNKGSKIHMSLKEFCNYLWFVKDNSVNVYSTGIYSKDNVRAILNSSSEITNSYAKVEETEFSLDEIVFTLKLITNFQRVAFTKIDIPNYEIQEGLTFIRNTGGDIEYNLYNRIERAMSFLRKARATTILAEKVSFYVLVLECLFSANQKDEIVHKISERIAIYLEEHQVERLIVFKDIKDLYSVRSKYVHGQSLDNKFNTNEKLVPYSVKADSYVRRILIKVINENSTEFLAQDNDLNNWFNEQLFSNG